MFHLEIWSMVSLLWTSEPPHSLTHSIDCTQSTCMLTVTCFDPPPAPKVVWMTRECSSQLPVAANTTANTKTTSRARIRFSFTTRAHPIDIVARVFKGKRLLRFLHVSNVASTSSVHGTGRWRSTARLMLSIQLLLADPSRRLIFQRNKPQIDQECRRGDL